jgi:hypothetical protein
MKTAGLILVVGLVSARVFAGGAEDLIALDKAWGAAQEAAEVEAMLSADLIAVDEEGLSGKAEQLAAMAEAPEGPYVAGDYKVNFIDGDTAVMVHSAGSGENTHWSMHVWKKTGGHWQVVATASVKADD